MCVVSGWVGYLRADDPRGKDAVGRAKLYFADCHRMIVYLYLFELEMD